MFTVHISRRKKFIEIPLSTRGLLLSVLLVFSTVALAGPRNKPGQRYTIFDAPNATYTQAGNINDAGSKVAKLKSLDRNYGLLADLNTRPRTTYLAEIRNPNPELET